MNRYPYLQRTEGSAWSMAQLLISIALTGAALGLYAVAASLDDRAEAQIQSEAIARAERTRLNLPANLQVAYEQGLADAAQGCAMREVAP